MENFECCECRLHVGKNLSLDMEEISYFKTVSTSLGLLGHRLGGDLMHSLEANFVLGSLQLEFFAESPGKFEISSSLAGVSMRHTDWPAFIGFVASVALLIAGFACLLSAEQKRLPNFRLLQILGWIAICLGIPLTITCASEWFESWFAR
jgi:hypothetical protein